MCYVHKLIKAKGSSEKGFVLVVAIIAILIMTAIGFFALTTISGDIMITSRLASERRAFSAAESGVHAVFTSLDLSNIGAANVTDVLVDPSDPNLTYSAGTSSTNQRVTVYGFETSSTAQVFETTVTGRNAGDGSEVRIAVGVTPPPTTGGTEQGRL
ncbi:MAG: pilus assembly PilX N-terminal domain-containing protein [Smithella sp.]|jgi:Tfp pilus assembly protein PilX